jgi:hypothetical protein
MKTSNKLLLGLFVIIVIFIIAANVTLKRNVESNIKSNVRIEVNSSDSVAAADSDSVAMEKAIKNE